MRFVTIVAIVAAAIVAREPRDELIDLPRKERQWENEGTIKVGASVKRVKRCLLVGAIRNPSRDVNPNQRAIFDKME